MYTLQGDTDRSTALLNDALALGEEIHDLPGEAVARMLLAMVDLHRGDETGAENGFREALAKSEAAGALVASAWCLWASGWAAVARGDTQEAAARFERALDLGRCEGAGEDFLVHAQAALAPLAALSGDTDKAQSLSRDAVGSAHALGYRQLILMALLREAEVALLVDKDRAAERALRESLEVLRQIGGDAWVADALESVALLAGGRGRHTVAARFLGASDMVRRVRSETGETRIIYRHIERYRAAATQAVGAVAFEAEYARGGALGAVQAVSEALAELRGDETGQQQDLIDGGAPR
jgi:tetratricopeptide (TPR) repeat protein